MRGSPKEVSPHNWFPQSREDSPIPLSQIPMSPVVVIETEVDQTLPGRQRWTLNDHELRDLTAVDGSLPSLRQLVTLPLDAIERTWQGILRRLHRERRRRKVGRAYDMALEIAKVIPRQSSVLDVGCGNGYITHHLSAMLGTNVLGIDLNEATEATIDYRCFDGTRFPVADQSVDAVSLCYILHHAQDLSIVISELRRVLRAGGLAVVYEDIPNMWWDRFVCRTHNLKWRKKTGPCTFRLEQEWRNIFGSAGFRIVSERRLSRWRNLAHPVCRRFYLLQLTAGIDEFCAGD